jgi:hypothetical protein
MGKHQLDPEIESALQDINDKFPSDSAISKYYNLVPQILDAMEKSAGTDQYTSLLVRGLAEMYKTGSVPRMDNVIDIMHTHGAIVAADPGDFQAAIDFKVAHDDPVDYFKKMSPLARLMARRLYMTSD